MGIDLRDFFFWLFSWLSGWVMEMFGRVLVDLLNVLRKEGRRWVRLG